MLLNFYHFFFSVISSDSQQSVSLTRSGSFMSPAAVTSSLSRQPQVQSQRKCSFDGNGGSDDSMHEKYFKSVENTPVSRRRHTTSSKQKHSSDSSPQSPISPQNQVSFSFCFPFSASFSIILI
jgi:hypothetical protein